MDRSKRKMTSAAALNKDKQPVKTIYLGSIPLKLTKKEINDYFKEFGKVSSISIRNGAVKSNLRYCFVTFEDVIGASKVLAQKKAHHISGKRIRIKRANAEILDDSTEASEEDAGTSSCDVPATSILNLNSDCVFHLFSFLGLEDQINLSDVCPRFNEILETILKRYKTLDLVLIQNLPSRPAQRYVFKNVGKYVTKVLTDAYVDLTLFEFVTRSCPNIKSLDVNCTNIHPLAYKELQKIFPKLTSLIIYGINESLCLPLKKCHNLRHLELLDCAVTGNNLHFLRHIKTLTISHCFEIKASHFARFFEVCKLTELDITETVELDKMLQETLVRTQTELRRLRISQSYSENLNDIVKLKNLIHLEISSNKKLTNDFFTALVRHKSDQLEILELCEDVAKLNRTQQNEIYKMTALQELCVDLDDEFLAGLAIRKPNLKVLHCWRCPDLTNEAIFAYVAKAKNLKTLHLPGWSKITTRDFTLRFIEVLKDSNRSKPLELYVPDFNRSDFEVLKLLQLAEEQRLLKMVNWKTRYLDKFE